MPHAHNYPQDPIVGLLAWYRAMGVDAAVGEVPIDWAARTDGPGAHFRTAQPSSPEPPRQDRAVAAGIGPQATADSRGGAKPQLPGRTAPPVAPPTARQFTPQTPDAAQMAARRLAEGAASLDALIEILSGFDGCGLKTTAMNLCVYRGAPKAKLMIIGEAPGREEDIAGKPFVGPAGQLLDKMLSAAGLDPATLHITNAVYWRPPGNRAPTPEETEVCRPFLERQIALVEPDVVLVLGGTAAKTVLSVTEGITRVRGQWHEIEAGARKLKAMATLHPAYLLRTPAAKRQAWRDLLAIRAALA